MLEAAGEFGVGGLASGPVPRGAAFLVQGLGGPGHDVERVHGAYRVRSALGDHVGDPLGAVGTDMGEPVGAVGAQRVEEGAEHVLAVAVGHPHHVPRVVVDQDGHVLLSAAVGDLVDADTSQAGEPVDPGVGVRLVAGDDRADRAPGGPHQLGGGGLGAFGGHPGDLPVEVAGVSGVVAGPGDGGDHHPVPLAGHTGCLGLQTELEAGGVQVPPAPPPRTGDAPETWAGPRPR